MEISKGMYVRTKNNGICKLYREFHEDSVDVGIGVFPEIDGFFIDKEEINYIEKDNILKSNKNIIDLIEVGDYVNGDLVLFAGATTWDNDGNVLDKQVYINHNGYDLWLREEYIKSIVTKEQFESMAYEVEK